MEVNDVPDGKFIFCPCLMTVHPTIDSNIMANITIHCPHGVLLQGTDFLILFLQKSSVGI